MIQLLTLGSLSLCASADGGLGARPPLEGVDWQLIEMVGGDAALPQADRPSLRLERDGHQVSGYSGCNQFFGSYHLDGNRLEIGQLGRTMRACEGVQMETERAFLDALGRTRGYRIATATLELLEGDRVVARFTLEATD